MGRRGIQSVLAMDSIRMGWDGMGFSLPYPTLTHPTLLYPIPDDRLGWDGIEWDIPSYPIALESIILTVSNYEATPILKRKLKLHSLTFE